MFLNLKLYTFVHFKSHLVALNVTHQSVRECSGSMRLVAMCGGQIFADVREPLLKVSNSDDESHREVCLTPTLKDKEWLLRDATRLPIYVQSRLGSSPGVNERLKCSMLRRL